MQSLPIIFSAVFAAIGFVISLSVGLIVQNEILYVIWVAVICLILSGALGIGVYKVLELKVPEFLSILKGEAIYAAEGDMDPDLSEESLASTPGRSDGEDGDILEGDPDKAKVFGDHIIVNKVKIKNEPKLIAQAIQTMLAKDN